MESPEVAFAGTKHFSRPRLVSQPKHGVMHSWIIFGISCLCSSFSENTSLAQQPWQPSLLSLSACFRISTEHSPKLQIRSHSYLRAVSEVSINRSLDTLDPKTLLDPKMLLSSPQYRSRNESYMRAMSTISQVGRAPPFPLKGYISDVTKIPACKQEGVH